MNRIKTACSLFLACCLLFCSACGMNSNNNVKTAPASTEIAESSKKPIIWVSEINGTPTIEHLDPSDVEKYYDKEFTHDEIPDDLLQAFTSTISSEELQIVKKAWVDVPSEALRGVEAHIYVLLRALQNTENTDIEIASAKFVPYAIDEKYTSIEETFGCDGYALQITDDSDNIYLVWDGFVYEKVICNGETIYSRYHVVF